MFSIEFVVVSVDLIWFINFVYFKKMNRYGFNFFKMDFRWFLNYFDTILNYFHRVSRIFDLFLWFFFWFCWNFGSCHQISAILLQFCFSFFGFVLNSFLVFVLIFVEIRRFWHIFKMFYLFPSHFSFILSIFDDFDQFWLHLSICQPILVEFDANLAHFWVFFLVFSP